MIREKGLDPESPELVDKLKENDSFVHAMGKLQGLVHEVNRFGSLSRGIEEGLVDFPCQFGDEIIFLCWRYGEESVGHWHRVEDGFAGRRPLLDLSEMGGSFYH
ncbi:MAG: DUF2203 domain-containing protein [Candidatus Binatia bacterium]|nr:DUF2203 domain-containing protein [Candidatus Binatia bacterium]